MCGRTRAALAADAVADAVPGCDLDGWVDRDAYRPRENAAPGAWMPVAVVGGGGGGAAEGRKRGRGHEGEASPPQRHLHTMRWGLVPFFTKPAPDNSGDGALRPQGSPYDHFNSRAERVREQPLTRRLFSGFGGEPSSSSHPPHRRGVAVVQGFYEWKADAGKRKQGYYVQLQGGRPMRLAAVWDSWSGGGGGGDGGGAVAAENDAVPSFKLPLHTFSIVTVDSSRELAWLHDRQPAVLLTDADVDAWLGGDSEAAERALVSVGGKGEGEGGERAFEWWPVTHEINSPSYSGKDAALDVRKRKGTITSFFQATPSPLKKARGGGGGGERTEEDKGRGAAAGGAKAAGEVKKEEGDKKAAAVADAAAGGVKKEEKEEEVADGG
jgi:putative SOS response-associated peptidase YedK